MIVSFADKDTESIARGYRVKQFDSFARIAQRKLRQLEIAGSIQDLRIPPGNRLENWQEIAMANGAYESTTNFASAFDGQQRDQRMSK